MFVTITLRTSIPAVTVLYILTNIAYLTLLSPLDIIRADALALSFASQYSSEFALFMAVSVALSTFGAANGSCLTGSRLTLAAARKRHMPRSGRLPSIHIIHVSVFHITVLDVTDFYQRQAVWILVNWRATSCMLSDVQYRQMIATAIVINRSDALNYNVVLARLQNRA